MPPTETIPAVTVRRLVESAVEYFPGLTVEDMFGRNRTASATAARAAVAFTLKEAGWTSAAIGRALGRDHSTVWNLITRHQMGAYPPASLPQTVSAPRDIGALISRVAELEATVAGLRSEIEAINRSFIRRAG